MADINKEYLTKEKFAELQKELEFLRTTRRQEVAHNLEYAKALGDLSENAEYHEARDEQAEVEDRIKHLEEILKTAIIMELHHSDAVGIGSVVTAENQTDGKKQKFKIVGSEEADIIQGKISLRSPMGVAMMGKKKGEMFKVKTPKGEVSWKIVTIE